MTLICAVIGSLLAQLPYFSLFGALIIALILGMIFQTAGTLKSQAGIGIGFISNKFLRLGIILLGFKLNLIQLAQAGIKTILLAVVVVSGTICLTYFIERKFGVEPELAILAASGTGICGAAAVMGISPQIKVPEKQAERQRENEVLAVAIVAIMGTIFTFIDLGLKPLLGLNATQFGVFVGGSLHEIAHAVAAGSAAGSIGLDNAIITKLSRVLMLAPAALAVGFWYQKHSQKTQPVSDKKPKLPIPWFMGGFILASVLGTFLPFSTAALTALVKVAYIFLGMAMAALGMSVNFRVILKRGLPAFAAAFISSVILAIGVLIASKIWF
ncbi:YeiH family protein [Liquorilactobacillus nagelii]|uniref:YeiH family protein n=1 Tax=Liquorilactobacillus nagelii TaxID=82688 RepID=UPI001CCCFD42|nr:putative sulfate exporter family transporter [Liquorilactobacillus nagelii]ULQ50572.1 putative sulfate exporter family transporter [Liquorilactobacillus nagelii]